MIKRMFWRSRKEIHEKSTANIIYLAISLISQTEAFSRNENLEANEITCTLIDPFLLTESLDLNWSRLLWTEIYNFSQKQFEGNLTVFFAE